MEHLHHFHLTQDPFQNEPDLRFYCGGETHRRAQLRLDRALRQNKGLVVLSGEGGTGKSLLARRMFEELEEEMFESSLLIMMQGTADANSVLRRFAAQLGVEDPPSERAGLLGALYEQLAIVREDGRHAVLIVDDAHVLGADAMAEIGCLLNLEYEDRRLLSMLLVGVPELEEIVASIPSLAERVDVRVRLQPLSEGEATAYLAHRIQTAGGDPQIFDESAMKAVFSLGGGRPRRLNTLADNALFEAFLGGRTQVGEDDVRRAGADLSFEIPTGPPVAMPQPASAVASAPAPSMSLAEPAPKVDSSPFAAATELAIESMTEALDITTEPIVEAPRGGITLPAAEPIKPEAEAEPQATQLVHDLGDIDALSMSSSSLDLAGLLGSDSTSSGDLSLSGASAGELELDAPIALDDSMSQSFPDFTAKNTADPTAEATRLALPDEESFSAAVAATETTDSDEIDDLFVELLDD